VALVLALAQASCATDLFARTPRSREQAIRTCASDVPADAVPYADAFLACMDERGFVYTGTTGPRD
jgi:hypothetical protein